MLSTSNHGRFPGQAKQQWPQCGVNAHSRNPFVSASAMQKLHRRLQTSNFSRTFQYPKPRNNGEILTAARGFPAQTGPQIIVSKASTTRLSCPENARAMFRATARPPTNAQSRHRHQRRAVARAFSNCGVPSLLRQNFKNLTCHGKQSSKLQRARPIYRHKLHR